MISFPFFSQSVVGVDIQVHDINLVQIRKTRRGYCIDQALTNKYHKPWDWDDITASLSEMVRQANLAGIPTAISLPAKLVCMQHLQLPSGMTENLIEAEIHAQVNKDFPGMNSSLNLDYVVTEKKTGYADIFFVIARAEHISQYTQCIAASGLKLKIIDIDIYALKRLFEASLPPLKQDDVHVVLIKLQHYQILIITDNQEILLHYEWGIEIEWLQIENRIQVFFATFPHKKIHTFAMFGNEKAWLEKANKLGPCITKELNPWIASNLDSHINFAAKNMCDFLVASGSAMRDMPKW